MNLIINENNSVFVFFCGAVIFTCLLKEVKVQTGVTKD